MAFAQQPQSGPPNAGPTGGAPALRSINKPNERGRLLEMPAVQEDLQLTDAQKDQLKALLAKKADSTVQTTPVNVNQQIKEILTKDQLKRLEQIRLQIAGLMAVVQPRIAKKLELTDQQTQQIQTLVQKAKQDLKAERPKPKHAGLELREKVDPQIRPILTPAQLTAWDTLVGRPFVLEK